jgi:capsular polysaccharide biosynthesis protein
MTFQLFIQLLRKYIWLIITITSFTVIATVAITNYFITPIYSNSTTLLVNDKKAEANHSLRFDDILLYEKLLGTYREIIFSKRILSPVVTQFRNQYELELSEGELRDRLKVTTTSNSQIITITALHPDYSIATNLVNWTAESFRERLNEIMNVDNVQILDSALLEKDIRPISPNLLLNTVISFLAGIQLSISIILLLFFMDTRIRTEEDVIQLMDKPLLGTIPIHSRRNYETKPYRG